MGKTLAYLRKPEPRWYGKAYAYYPDTLGSSPTLQVCRPHTASTGSSFV